MKMVKALLALLTGLGAFIASADEYSTEIVDGTVWDYRLINDGVEIVRAYDLPDNVVIPSFLGGRPVISIGQKAFSSGRMDSIVIPEGVKSIDQSAFEDACMCSVTLPSTLVSIGANAFANCRSVTSFDLPEGLLMIGGNAFFRCYGITEIDIRLVTE